MSRAISLSRGPIKTRDIFGPACAVCIIWPATLTHPSLSTPSPPGEFPCITMLWKSNDANASVPAFSTRKYRRNYLLIDKSRTPFTL